ncbi:MAG: hypothetical protein SGCHY_005220 [Lobulomycetales sp.]
MLATDDEVMADILQATDSKDDAQGGRENILSNLKSVYRNESAAPEILEYATDLVFQITSQLDYQASLMDDTDLIVRYIYAQEIARIRYLLRAYQKVRLEKIEKYAHAYVSNPVYRNRLSQSELEFATGFVRITHESLHKSVLRHLPASLQTMDSDDMIPVPDQSAGVIFRVVEGLGTYRLENSQRLVNLEKGSVHMTSYASVKTLLQQNSIQLI